MSVINARTPRDFAYDGTFTMMLALYVIAAAQAAANGHIKVVEFLVKSKADVNIKDRFAPAPIWHSLGFDSLHLIRICTQNDGKRHKT